MSDDGSRGAPRDSTADPRYPEMQAALSRAVAGMATRRRVASDSLFQGGRELVIVHVGKEYVLRITRQGKLILTA